MLSKWPVSMTPGWGCYPSGSKPGPNITALVKTRVFATALIKSYQWFRLVICEGWGTLVNYGQRKTVDALKTSQKEKDQNISTVQHFPRSSPVYTAVSVCAGLVTAVHRPVRPSSEVKMLPGAGWRLSGAVLLLWLLWPTTAQQQRLVFKPRVALLIFQWSVILTAASSLVTSVTMKLIPATATLLPFLVINSVMAQEVSREHYTVSQWPQRCDFSQQQSNENFSRQNQLNQMTQNQCK